MDDGGILSYDHGEQSPLIGGVDRARFTDGARPYINDHTHPQRRSGPWPRYRDLCDNHHYLSISPKSDFMIPLFCAKTVNADFDLITPLQRVVESHWYVLGQEVGAFEQEFAAYVGVAHCIGLGNGTDALELALKALEIGPGDVVACAANAGFYSSTAIHLVGATALYVDIGPHRMAMCPVQLEKQLKALKAAQQPLPKAIMVTHLYGQAAPIQGLVKVAKEYGIVLIEDCAQAHGARVDGQMVGSFGDIACFSFYPTKNLGAIGDGGAICTNNTALNERVRQLRQYGWSSKYTVSVPYGRNSRLDELQAAVLRVKLPKLDKQNAQRRAIAVRYNTAFAQLAGLTLPISVGDDYVAHLYVVRTPQRDALAKHLKALGVSTDVHYPLADTQQPAYPQQSALPISQTACDQVLSLPCYPGMTQAQVDTVIDAVKTFFISDVCFR